MKPNIIVITIFLSTAFAGLRVTASEAIPFFSPAGGIVGYVANGAGFSFKPLAPIAVTSLGFGGDDLVNSPYVVSLFNASGAQLATATVTTGSTLLNQSYYQTITPVNLSAGATYYLGAEELGTNIWVGRVVGANSTGTFSVNPAISYLSYETGFMPPGSISPSPGDSVDYFTASNFQFTTVPEPSTCWLGLAGFCIAVVYRRLQRVQTLMQIKS